jgi:hypothetical protein
VLCNARCLGRVVEVAADIDQLDDDEADMGSPSTWVVPAGHCVMCEAAPGARPRAFGSGAASRDGRLKRRVLQ